MEQQNNSAVINDTAGVLPMDAGVTANGIHDESENNLSSSNAGAKKGRGRPPKSTGSTKVVVNSDTPKKGRGRPPKSGEAAPSPPPPPQKVVSPAKNKEEEAPTNGDDKKKRGRPSKTSTPSTPPSQQTNGISKPQVRSTPVTNYREVEEDFDEPTKKRRGRPSGGSPKKAVVSAVSSAPKEAALSTKKRGRPSGTASAKKAVSKPKVSVSDDGSAKKRGRPKKAAGSPTPAAAASPVNETAATVTPNAVQ